MDHFYEQLVTTEKSVTYKIMSAMVYVFGIIAILMLFMFRFIPAAVFGIPAAVAFFTKKNFYVEYEYAFTNGQIDIDTIKEMKKRETVLEFDIKNVELLALEDSDYIKDFDNKPSKVLNFYPESCKEKVYVAMITGGNERVMLRFVPDQKLLENCFKYNPRAVKKS